MPFLGLNFDEQQVTNALRSTRATSDVPFEGNPNEIGSELQAKGLNEFRDAGRRFEGVTQSVFDESNQVGLRQAVNQAGVRSEAASDAQEGAILRRQRGLGLNLTGRQQKSQNRRVNLTRELAKASAKGATRRGFRDRAELARRGAGSLEDQAFGIEADTEVGLTNAAGQEKVRQEQEASRRKQARNSLIGSVIGIGATFLSDENMKTSKRNFAVPLLERLKKVRVEKWKYVGEDTDHIGPYAQEFNDAFGVGQDDNTQISVIDALGVTLGAVKELSEQVNG